MNRGARITLLFITVNLLLAAFLVVILLNGFRDLLELIGLWPLNIALGVGSIYVLGYLLGKKMDALIHHKHWNALLVGIAGAFLILLTGTALGSSVGFYQEGLDYWDHTKDLGSAIEDYFFKPMYWIMLFGTLPTLISGALMGYLIKRAR